MVECINYPSPKQEYKVMVSCQTYNQSKYIEDALNGFAMQQTNFPFVCLVMDDASTDGEQEVIKSWMEHECDMDKAETIDIPTTVVIIVPHKNNPYCTFAFYFLKQNLYGTGKKQKYLDPWREKCEYYALCEGDDYWIDPLKLQKQVGYLDFHPQCGMTYGKVRYFLQAEDKFYKVFGSQVTSLRDLLYTNPIPTPSVVIRSVLLKEFKFIKNDNWKMGDFPLWLYLHANSESYFFNEVLAVYRVLEESASHSTNYQKKKEFVISTNDIREFFNERYRIVSSTELESLKIYALMQNALFHEQYRDYCQYFYKLPNKNIKEIIRYIIVKLGLYSSLRKRTKNKAYYK